MNTATIRGRRLHKRPPLSSSSASASLLHDAEKKIFFSDNLRQCWEQIVSKERE